MTRPSFRGRSTLTCDLPSAPVLARHTGLRLEACRVRGPAVALGSGRQKTRRIRHVTRDGRRVAGAARRLGLRE
jgi:hypothetical protein